MNVTYVKKEELVLYIEKRSYMQLYPVLTDIVYTWFLSLYN